MDDLEIDLGSGAGRLALVGETLGRAGISIEGGGMFVVAGRATAHFLVADGMAARAALQAVGIEETSCRTVLTLRLDQERPGQLGKVLRAMADAGVGIEVQYSDHDGRLVLVVDDPSRAEQVAAAWP